MEVLFALLAERYERRSVAITSNLVFSKWDQIFQDPMTTAAAIDRVVHHSVILELNVKSYRAQAAHQRTHPDAPGTMPRPMRRDCRTRRANAFARAARPVDMWTTAAQFPTDPQAQQQQGEFKIFDPDLGTLQTGSSNCRRRKK